MLHGKAPLGVSVDLNFLYLFFVFFYQLKKKRRARVIYYPETLHVWYL